MKHASLTRFALAWSRKVTARIRSWWLNGTVTLWRIHAACSEFGCNHKSNTGSKDQKQKYGEFWHKKERYLEDTHHIWFWVGFREGYEIQREQGFNYYIYEFSILPRKKTESQTTLLKVKTFLYGSHMYPRAVNDRRIS